MYLHVKIQPIHNTMGEHQGKLLKEMAAEKRRMEAKLQKLLQAFKIHDEKLNTGVLIVHLLATSMINEAYYLILYNVVYSFENFT